MAVELPRRAKGNYLSIERRDQARGSLGMACFVVGSCSVVRDDEPYLLACGENVLNIRVLLTSWLQLAMRLSMRLSMRVSISTGRRAPQTSGGWSARCSLDLTRHPCLRTRSHSQCVSIALTQTVGGTQYDQN